MGMNRPDLAEILIRRAKNAGVEIRFSTTVTSSTQDASGVDVVFSDGSADRYDLVIGADGIRSATRQLLGAPLDTRPVGLGIWRVFAPRPDAVVNTEAYYGGVCAVAGYTPTSRETLYAFLTEQAQDRSMLTPEETVETVRELMSGYHGPWDEIRESVTDAERINYTWIETHLLDAPWHRGRTVLIGDAVHTCPPTLAQGAAMALEDASVLAEMVVAADAVDDAVLTAFAERRIPRVRAVVESSLQLAQWQIDGIAGDVPELMGKIAAMTGQEA
jgi:2-polyprenyl-6-methoxyphenol hydroxylase-like FAD-dependent oxidoreductase